MDGAKDPKYLITNNLRLEAQAVLENYSWRWLIEEFFSDEKKLLDFEGARVRNYQAGAIKVLILSCADLLLSLEVFKLSQKKFSIEGGNGLVYDCKSSRGKLPGTAHSS